MGEQNIHLGIKGEAFASGEEKKVFEHRDPDKVVKVTILDDEGKFDLENERYIKAEFYLTKILHSLFPQNIPDIHLASFKHKATVHEKKSLDREHIIVRDAIHNYDYLSNAYDEFIDARLRLKQRRNETSLIRRLQKLGIVIDRAYQNFGQDKNGHTVYLDSIIPWVASHRFAPNMKFATNFNTDQLRDLINDELDEPDRSRSLNYLDRLIVLAEEERRVHESIQKHSDTET